MEDFVYIDYLDYYLKKIESNILISGGLDYDKIGALCDEEEYLIDSDFIEETTILDEFLPTLLSRRDTSAILLRYNINDNIALSIEGINYINIFDDWKSFIAKYLLFIKATEGGTMGCAIINVYFNWVISFETSYPYDKVNIKIYRS